MHVVTLPLPSTAAAVIDERRGCGADAVLMRRFRWRRSALSGSIPRYKAYIIATESQPARLQSAQPLQVAAPRSWWRVGLREINNFSCWLRGAQKNPARAAPTLHDKAPSPGPRQGKARLMLPLPRPLTSLLEEATEISRRTDWHRQAQTGSSIYPFTRYTELEPIIHRQISQTSLVFFFLFGCPWFPDDFPKAAPPPPTDRPCFASGDGQPQLQRRILSPSPCLYFQSDRPGC